MQPLLAGHSVYDQHQHQDQLAPTLLQLLDEVVDDLLQLRAVHGKSILEVLNLLQKILRQIVHGS